MKKFLRLISAMLVVPLLIASALAQEALSPKPTFPQEKKLTPLQEELVAITQSVMRSKKDGTASAETLASTLASLDALLQKYPEESPRERAWVVSIKASLYFRDLRDYDMAQREARAAAEMAPDDRIITEWARKFAEDVEVKKKSESLKNHLIGSKAPVLNFTWASVDGLKTLDDLRGKVVVIDFWATWCGPCIKAFPKIREEVAYFEESPVLFLGVTSLQGKVHNLESKPIDVTGSPEREYELISQFMKKKEMTWPVAVSKQNAFNPEYGVVGIPHLAILDPTGTLRFNGINPGDPAADVVGKVTALLKEFNLPLPRKNH